MNDNLPATAGDSILHGTSANLALAAQRSLINALPGPIALLDPAGIILAVNEGWLRVAANSPLQGSTFTVGCNYLELCNGVSGPEADEARKVAVGIQQVLAGATELFTTIYQVSTEGHPRWFRLTATLLRGGASRETMVAHVDISAQRESEERFRAIIDSSLDAIVTMDHKGITTEFNRAAEQIFGRLRGEAVGKPMAEMIIPERFRERHRQGLARYMKTGEGGILSRRLEFPGLRADGTEIPVELTITRMGDIQPLCFTGFLRDISERKKVEQRLLRLNRLHSVLSGIGEMVVRTRERPLLYETICRICVDDGQLRAAAIYHVDESADLAEMVAFYGEEKAHVEALPVNVKAGPRSLGPLGTALRTGLSDVCNDVMADSRMAPWQESASRHEIRSVAAFPLRPGNVTIGALVLFASEVNYFQADEIRLVEAAAKEASFALEAEQFEQRRERAEMALRASEDLFSSAFKSSAIGMALGLPKGEYLKANPALCEMLGYSEPELLALACHGITHPADQAEDARQMDALLESDGNSYQIEKRYLHRNGSIIWVQMTVSLVRDKEGVPTHLIAQIQEITARRLAEENLRQGEMLQRIATRMGRLGAWSIDFPGQKVTWSEEVCVIHEVPSGYSPTIEEGMRFCAPDFREIVAKALESCVRDATPIDVEYQITTTSGKRTWVRSLGEAIKDSEGRICRLEGAFQDISDHKRREQELAQTNRALKMLSGCNEAVIRAEDEQEILEKICQIAVEIGGYRMAWVGYAEESAPFLITPVAFAGAENGYLARARVTWDANEPSGQGPAGITIRTGEVVYTEDFMQTSTLRQWYALAEERGYRGLICLPLRAGAKTFGLLGLYSSEVMQPTGDEKRLLQEMADDLAFGILTLRSKIAQQKTHEAVLKMARGVSSSTGAEFFERLTESMVEVLGAQAGFIARLVAPDQRILRTVCAMVDGEVVPSFDYDLAGTPCEHLDHGDIWIIPKEARREFPASRTLAEMQVESLAATKLTDASGSPIGLMFVHFRHPIEQTEFISSTLKIFAARAASELERQQIDAHTREQAALLDKARDAIVVRDLDHRVIYWNKGAERLFGWTAEEARGCLVSGLLKGDETRFRQAEKVVRELGEWTGEMQKTARNGSVLILDSRWTLVRDADGQPRSILAINTDITERKKIEQQFLRSQRMESIGTLAGGIAHDLNNTLAPIIMSLELLKMKFGDADSQKLLSTISDSALRGADMVKQVLSFARGVEGRRVEVDLISLLGDIVKIVSDTFYKNIRVQTAIVPELWTILGDSTQIHQVLLNLCVNARDAMPEGGTLQLAGENLLLDSHFVTFNPEAKPGPYVAIQVEDNGAGIPKTVIDQIFDPFFTTKEVGKGTGLGLSTSLAIIKSHGGFMQVYSEEGQGTKFKIFLPAVPGKEGAVASASRPELPMGNGELILVVDDEEAVRNITEKALENFGYRVLTASNGAEAVAIYAQRSGEIDVVFTDMMMPVMDGPSTIRVLRRIQPSVRIIGSSGLSANGHGAKASSLGLKHFLPKPYTTAALLLALRQILSDR